MRYLLSLLIFIFYIGCSSQTKIKHFELAENKVVTTGTEYSKVIFQKKIETKGYRTIRVFAHIFNESYKEKPIPSNSKFSIVAYYGIGKGSWGYFEKSFPFKSTSGWSGVVDIPIVGEITRIGIYTSEMKNRKLKVDVVTTLLN